MTPIRARFVVLLCTILLPAAARAQSFYAVVSGETPGALVQLRGTAFICDYTDGQFMVLSDSATGRGISFLFHHPTRQDQNRYLIGGEDEGADVFVEYVPVDRSNGYTGSGELIVKTLGPQGMTGEFTLQGTSRAGGNVIVTGSLTARALGFLAAGEHCSREVKEQRLSAHGWTAETLQAVRANEITVGMTNEMVLESWGVPRDGDRQRTAAGTIEEWRYPNATVTLQNGRVTLIRD